MKNLSIFFFLFHAFLFGSCKEPMPTLDIEDEIVTPTPDTIPYIWKARQPDGVLADKSINPVLYNGSILISDGVIFVSEKFKLFDPDGSMVWEWGDWLQDGVNIASRPGAALVDGNKVFTHTNGDELTLLDLENGVPVWQHTDNTYNVGRQYTIIDNYIYGNIGTSIPEGSPFDSIVHLARMSIDSPGQWDIIYTEEEGGDKLPRFIPPVRYINDKGEEIIAAVYDRADLNVNLNEVYLIGYNLTVDTLIYKTPYSIDKLGSTRSPLLHNNLIYFPTVNKFHCFNIETGQQIWHKTFDDPIKHLLTSEMIIYDEKIIVKASNYDLYAWDLETGAVIWHNPDAGIVPSNLVAYGDYIYYTGENFRAVNVKTGEVVWNIPSSYSSNFQGHGVAIDEDRKRLYLTDGSYLYAVPLIE